MKYIVNCNLRPGKDRDAFVAMVKQGPADAS